MAESLEIGLNEFGDGLEAAQLAHGVTIFLVEAELHECCDRRRRLMVQVGRRPGDARHARHVRG